MRDKAWLCVTRRKTQNTASWQGKVREYLSSSDYIPTRVTRGKKVSSEAIYTKAWQSVTTRDSRWQVWKSNQVWHCTFVTRIKAPSPPRADRELCGRSVNLITRVEVSTWIHISTRPYVFRFWYLYKDLLYLNILITTNLRYVDKLK
jgi:hypothetical protein